MLAALAIGVPLVIGLATVGFGAGGAVIAARSIMAIGALALAGWLLIMVFAIVAYNTEPDLPTCASLQNIHPYPYGRDCK